MDIASISTNISTANLSTDFGVAMLSKSLDSAKASGDKMVEMIDSAAMEQSVNPFIGKNFDISI